MDPRAVLLTAFLSGAGVTSPAAVAVANGPGSYDVAGAYTAASAAAPCRPDPRDLAAIQSVESPSAVVDPSGHVSNPDGSPVRGDGGQSFGPFQFYEVAGTWSTYGAGGDPDDLLAAASATARMLCANNYASDRHAAIARHNGSGPAAQAYADRVISAADKAQPITAAPITGSGGDDCDQSGGRSFTAVIDRAWSCLIVRPWMALGRKSPSPTWSKVDRVVFGDGAKAAPAPGSTSAGAPVDGIRCPVRAGVEVGDGWGEPRTGHTHQGVDVFGAADSPMVAPFDGVVDGVVSDEGAGGLGGMSVSVRATGGPHDGADVYLAHANRVDVTVGQKVKAGQQVGTVGNSGNARGGATHVHVQWYSPGSSSPEPAGSTIGRACGKDTDPT